MEASKPDHPRQVLAACRRAWAGVALFSACLNLLTLAVSLYMMQVYDRVLTTRWPPTTGVLHHANRRRLHCQFRRPSFDYAQDRLEAIVADRNAKQKHVWRWQRRFHERRKNWWVFGHDSGERE